MKIGVIIFTASFVLQLVIVCLLLTTHHQPELYEYDEIAVNLLTRQTFMCHSLGVECYSLVPPLYPLLCAGVYLATNYSRLALILVQMAFVSLLCVTIYLIGKEVFNKKAGLISAVLCMFHPGLIIYSTTKLHELSLVAFLFSVLILAILKFEKNLTYKRSFIIGMLTAAAILTRATIALFVPLFLAWLYVYRKGIFKSTKEYLLKSFFIIIIIAVIISPWIARNYHIHHKFLFMQFPTIDLWVGNNANATGGNYLNDGRMVLESMPKDFIDKVYSAANELDKDMIFKEAAYKFIAAHPYKAMFLFFKKMYYFWWFSPEAGIKYSWIYSFSYKIWYAIALFFAIAGFVLLPMNYEVKKKAYIIIALFLAISAAQSLFYVEGRHRWAIEPMLLIFTVNGIVNIKNMVKGNKDSYCE